MKAKFYISLAALALVGGCVCVDDEVAKTPSSTWKAPKEAMPEETISSERIKTEKILTEDELEKEKKAMKGEGKTSASKDADTSNDAGSSEVQKFSSAAEKLENGKTLDLADLVDLALENNTSTRMYWFQSKVYAAKLGVANSAYYPQISVSAQVYRSRMKTTTPSLPKIGAYYETGYGPAAEINWLIYDFGKREALVDSAREALRAANFDYNQIIQDVVLNVNLAYYDFYAANGNVKAAKLNLEDAMTAYDSANARFKEGVGNKQDMLTALANARNAEYSMEKASSEVENARATLGRALGVSVLKLSNISDEVKIPASEETSKKIDELVARALRSRQTLMASYANLRKAQSDTRATERNFLPQIGASGSAQYIDYTRSGRDASEQYAVGLTLSWSIFEGFARKYELISARAQERAQAQVLKDTEIKIISDVWGSYHSYQSAVKQVSSSEAAVEAAQEAFEATKAGYENGVSTLTDFLSAQSQLAQARQQKVLSNAVLASSIANLAHSTGALIATTPEDSEN